MPDRILIIDDDRLMRDMLPPVLGQSDERLSIESVGTPIEALRAIEQAPANEFLIVLSDYDLKAPLNGLDILAETKRLRPDAVRILFSGHAREEIRDIDAAKIDGFIEKPFRIQELVPPFREIVESARKRLAAPSQEPPTLARAAAAKALAPSALLPELVKAAGKGEETRAATLYEETRRRGLAEGETQMARTLFWQNRVLELIAVGAPLEKTLSVLTRAIENQVVGMLASILLVDESGTRLVGGAAPSLPPAYNDAIDGVPIAPNSGSCGTAAYEKQRVIVTDTQTDPRWKDFKDIARTHGLYACWSAPILSPNGRLFGTFALYYREPRAPTDLELQLIDLGTSLARVAIESHADRAQKEALLVRERAALAETSLMRERLRDVILQAPFSVSILSGPRHVYELANKGYETITGRKIEDILGKSVAEAFPEIGDVFYKALDGVYTTGIPFHAKGMLVPIDRGHGIEDTYFDFVYHPTRNVAGEIDGILVVANEVTHQIRAARDLDAAASKLRESEARYRSLYDALPVAAMVCDTNGDVKSYNARAVALWGFRPDQEPLSCRSLELLLPTGGPVPFEGGPIARVLRTGEAALNREFVLGRPDGGRIPVLANFCPLHDAEGRLVGVVTSFDDISEAKRREAELRDANLWVGLALESASIGAWDLDLVKDTSTRNLRHDQIFGYETGIAVWGKKQFFEHIVPEDRGEVDRQFANAVTTGVLRTECRIRRPDGAIRWVNIRGEVHLDHAGKPARMMGVIADITDEKELTARERTAHIAVQHERLRLRTLFMQAPAAIAIMEGPDHVFTFVNPDAAEILGRKEDELIGKAVRDALPEVAAQGFPQLLDDVRRTGQAFHAKGMPVTLHAGGPPRQVFLDFVYQPMVEPTGEVSSIMVHAVDVTQQVQARHQADDFAGELERRVQERTRALENANRDLESFNYVVSHDLRAPMRAAHHLLGTVLAALPSEAEKERASLVAAQTSVEDMARLTEGLLALARASRSQIQHQHVDLTGTARAVLLQLKLEEPARMVEFDVENGVDAHGDPRLLRSVMENLLGNAWKFTGTRSPARISFGAAPAEEPTYYVRDNGIGFDPEKASTLFQPFQRLAGPSGFEGTGIGLATVRRIIERHGGRVWVDAAPDKGATFYFTLPRRKLADEADGAAKA